VSIPDAATDNSHAMFRIMMTRSRPPSIQQLQAIPTVFIICNQHAREVRSQPGQLRSLLPQQIEAG
jgi:hypothetical protein